MTKLFAYISLFTVGFFSFTAHSAQSLALGQAEAEKCGQEISAITSDYLNKYAASLAVMQVSYQKSADLESALTVRAELTRVKTEQALTEQSFVAEPKSLRDLQVQTYGKIRDICAQILLTHIPRLSELKKSMTIDGDLDGAVAVRDLIGQLQDKYGATVQLESGAVVPAETLLQDYTADKDRADKLYKGRKITVSGSIAGFQQDPSDDSAYNIYLSARGASSLVQCSFPKQNFIIKEEKQGLGNVVLSMAPVNSKRSAQKPGSESRLFKGMMFNIEGVCNGMDKMVNMVKCNLGGR